MAYSDAPIDSSEGIFDVEDDDNMADASPLAEEDDVSANPAPIAAGDNDVVDNEAVYVVDDAVGHRGDEYDCGDVNKTFLEVDEDVAGDFFFWCCSDGGYKCEVVLTAALSTAALGYEGDDDDDGDDDDGNASNSGEDVDDATSVHMTILVDWWELNCRVVIALPPSPALPPC